MRSIPAVEDFYDATGFVINQSSDWNIDVEQIVASGSSAGAITVLQAEYDLCNGHELAKKATDRFQLCRCDLICRCGLWCASSTLGKDALSDYAIPWRCG